ncbi:hypothetical protein, conserved [Trypanosoma brucei brucei TREU927]|uniref:Uncharacterized protein n=1 Tax=Trypanosoma brucei brucei (strain 927/4 GUTat10.1) TaxID=185431 RepID=Q580S1_TRYB2|nr:hypothetical protein, conserved [Trypanosoma brucei brucei TREU927]AAX81063.1 hypothetical protein, conserved [Trypanosoma brucei]AAZ10585.1 hypothetical protein, conserved [Trypanosoma brucei brucei TREU927]
MPIPCNFKDQITGEVHIPSTSRANVTYKQCECQTGVLKMQDMETQTAISALQAVNRSDKQVGHEKPQIQANIDGLQYVYAGVNYSEEALADFLEAAREDVLAILYRNVKNSAFDNYEPNWTKKSTELSAVATFRASYAEERDLHALSVSFNSSGTLLAVAYGQVDTAGWCNDTGMVGIWNLSRNDVNVNEPHHMMETDSFVTCVAFHPSQATVLAVGLYSGEVVLYKNVTDATPIEMTADGSSTSHREPVTFLQWTENLQETRDSHRYTLCSAGQDGRILFWTMGNKMAQPTAAFIIKTRKGATVGVQSACFSRPGGSAGRITPSSDSVLVIGLENGDVGRARPGVLAALPTRAGESEVSLELDWLSSHRGPVQCVDTSPFFHNLCLTCSSDGSARLYNMLETAAVATLEPSAESKHFLYAARFSPFRPSVIAVVSRSSFLHIYDLQKSQLKPVVTLEAGTDGAALMCVTFNHASPDWICTGDVSGSVRLWKLPSSLMQTTDLERAAVRDSRGRGGNAEDSEKNAVISLFGFSL